MHHQPLIQIAGILDLQEAEQLFALGADWLGWPLRLPVNAEDVSERQAREIITHSSRPKDHVLITYENEAESAIRFCADIGVGKLQLHGEIPTAELQKIRSLAPGLFVIKSLVVRHQNEQDLQAQITKVAPFVDAFITDTFDPATGAEGATGKTHDWEISRRLVEHSPKPVILAGGLTADNVAEAIRRVRPAGVDVHTGIEGVDGRKNMVLAKRFIKQAHLAFAEQR